MDSSLPPEDDHSYPRVSAGERPWQHPHQKEGPRKSVYRDALKHVHGLFCAVEPIRILAKALDLLSE